MAHCPCSTVWQDFTQQHILPGGLFIGTRRRKLDAGWLSHVHEHDARIAALTGMTFGSDYRTQLLANSEIMLDSPRQPWASGCTTLCRSR
jgi:putative protein-disulfide isomerase